MLTLMRKLRIYTRITQLIDNHVHKHPDSVNDFDSTNFNTLYMAILGLAKPSRNILFKKVLIDLLARDNNILLDSKSRKYIRENFATTEQETIFYPQSRDISLLRHFHLGDLNLLLDELITIFFYSAPPIYLTIWKEHSTHVILKENLNWVADHYGQIIYTTTHKLFIKSFPSLDVPKL